MDIDKLLDVVPEDDEDRRDDLEDGDDSDLLADADNAFGSGDDSDPLNELMAEAARATADDDELSDDEPWSKEPDEEDDSLGLSFDDDEESEGDSFGDMLGDSAGDEPDESPSMDMDLGPSEEEDRPKISEHDKVELDKEGLEELGLGLMEEEEEEEEEDLFTEEEEEEEEPSEPPLYQQVAKKALQYIDMRIIGAVILAVSIGVGIARFREWLLAPKPEPGGMIAYYLNHQAESNTPKNLADYQIRKTLERLVMETVHERRERVFDRAWNFITPQGPVDSLEQNVDAKLKRREDDRIAEQYRKPPKPEAPCPDCVGLDQGGIHYSTEF